MTNQIFSFLRLFFIALIIGSGTCITKLKSCFQREELFYNMIQCKFNDIAEYEAEYYLMLKKKKKKKKKLSSAIDVTRTVNSLVVFTWHLAC